METSISGGHQTNSSTQNQHLYSNKVKSQSETTFPKKQQGILLNAVEGLKLADYVLKVGSLIGPRNIIFASRISNGRICMYLSNKNLVDQIVNNYGETKIDNHKITIRRLVTPARRIILSNACPTIPHDYLEERLKDLGLKGMSPMTFLRASVPGDEYSHVYSFRRQVYVQPDDNILLPPYINITFDNTEYRIFLAYDELTCFVCNQRGHIASHCKNTSLNAAPATPSLTVNDNQNDTVHDTLVHQELQTDPIDNNTRMPETKLVVEKRQSSSLKDTSGQNKRPASSTLSSPPTEKPNCPAFNFVKPSTGKKNKKKKLTQPETNLAKSDSTESLTSVTEQLESARNFIEDNAATLVLSYDQLVHFFENSYGNSDPLSIAREYTNNIPQFLQTLSLIYPHLTYPSIKARCTRIQNKIKKQLANELLGKNPLQNISNTESDSDTENSQF